MNDPYGFGQRAGANAASHDNKHGTDNGWPTVDWAWRHAENHTLNFEELSYDEQMDLCDELIRGYREAYLELRDWGPIEANWERTEPAR